MWRYLQAGSTLGRLRWGDCYSVEVNLNDTARLIAKKQRENAKQRDEKHRNEANLRTVF